MIPLLILAAGAAALEIKRLSNRPQGAEEAQALLKRERHLNQVLQVVLLSHAGWLTSVHILHPYVS